ncbi:MAG: ComF family protein [Lachnospiraceae bacterium]|jgi:ComF family protein|uniref:ComF family protein n=1 Tax=Hominisplanchenecus murintestinalis TaxID=2941517 RepID=A0AC61R2E9_9FIRM|nr:ComF family protein [Hominisplanchenecus murintestinalis]MCI9515488.1 ComF family protein [Lachnospiraceae bacterium]MCI9660319.1 ComF family protein [Lachnospiraceae bacterium]MDE6908646.1 ComF family protein [Lachnospiraceae bacterium]TGX99637.1 ComF family protein [Hominisplanchenecus murintestinalis]
MNRQLQKMLEILYPRHCPVCHEIVKAHGALICPGCRKKLLPIREPICKKCGKPIADPAQEYCEDCRTRRHLYTRGRAALLYTGEIKESVCRMKFHNKREYIDFYGAYMAEILGKKILEWGAQALIPVPLHRSKLRRRGFNQAELLAREIGRALGIPVRPDIVQRVRKTKPQKELLYRERQNNLKGAFKISQYDVKLKKIVLVDDIYTTGSTVDEIAGRLLEQGAKEVYFVSLCIGKDDG